MHRIFKLLFCFAAVHLYCVDFVLITQPKTGTHLLTPILAELTQRKHFAANKYLKDLDSLWTMAKEKGMFLHFHSGYFTRLETFFKERDCIIFFVKRDPRDQIVSFLNHNKYIKLLDEHLKKLDSDEEKLLYLIERRLRNEALRYKGWLNSPICCVLDFSKLMGAHGGAATDLDALGEMRKIAQALQLQISDASLEEVYRKCFGTGGTFFRGKVGSWKDYFNEDHKTAAKKSIGDLLIQLGYEKKRDW